MSISTKAWRFLIPTGCAEQHPGARKADGCEKNYEGNENHGNYASFFVRPDSSGKPANEEGLTIVRPNGAPKIQRGQATLRHTRLFADRCFLPDLAGLSNALLRRT